MAAADGFLIDASAVGRMMRPDVVESWREQLSGGRIGICAVTKLEVLHGARSSEEFASMRAGLDALYTAWPMPDAIEAACDQLQEKLAKAGVLGSAGVVALMVAATARHHGLTVLHYDPAFEAIARVTGQPTWRLAEPGSID